MKKTFYLTMFTILFYGCSYGTKVQDNPSALSFAKLPPYLIGYCWQMPEGRVSKNNPQDKEVSIAIGEVNGIQNLLLRNSYNFPPNHLSDFFIYKSGCVENGDDIRYIGNAISVTSKEKLLSFTSGSDVDLTDSEFFQIDTNKFSYTETPILDFRDYKDYFQEPQYIFWSPDSSKLATVGDDVWAGSTNIWVYDTVTKKFYKATKYTEIGEWVANAAWSEDGKRLAVGLGKESGIRIIDFSESTVAPSYVEISHKTSPEISEWPYIYKNLLQLALESENIKFTRYVYISSIPIWVNDHEIIFTAANEDGLASLYSMDDSGNNLKRLAENLSGNLFMPTLSPDGKTLAFVRYFSWSNKQKGEIGIINLETNTYTSLVSIKSKDNDSPLLISGMKWSPDGKYLAFSSNHEGESDIYIISSDGQSWTNVTANIDGNAVSPFWLIK